ncbi:MAG: type II secretion system F family protein, partial [Paracoccaceae bacterium]|nr:type II secretion system F family protein [Paracoccaceae bacterium]
VRQQLIHAGINSKNAVINYYVIRAVLGFGLPAIVITIIVGRGVFPYPEGLDNFLLGLDRMKVLQIVGLAVAVGFYAPAYWLRGKVKARQTRVERAFPNAMDLLQISVEAGMGFDAAMSRVGHELRSVAPEISEEFSVVQAEILAGRSRSKSLNDMAMRMGIEEATSFANVIVQSIRYGTPLSSALATYSEEMRNKRQMKAEEKANKLPVLMSGVLASLMLPALLLITLGPVIIRYVRYFGS